MKKRPAKPWGGRFSEPTDMEVERFTASIPFDRRLYKYDIEGSIAHAKMLSRQGIIDRAEGRKIVKGLREVLEDIEAGRFTFDPQDEDIHMAVERSLMAKVGEIGGKLHAGRSRNDQVSLDMRMYLREEIDRILELIRDLKKALLGVAKQEQGTIMPGYTHLQKAQPVILAHYLLAFWEMLTRDEERLQGCRSRVNVMPLGAAALAGTGLPIDRNYVARLLNFPDITKNSMDTVSDRDFVAEFIFGASLIMMHLSRLCEDLIIWSSDEFGYVEISDAFTTGSSIMPQKKNPDVAELIRGKTGRVYGDLIAVLTLLKGLPMTYNRDLQEDKEPLFDAVDTLKGALSVLTPMIGRLSFRRERMEDAAEKGFSAATDLAEYLVMKGVPFREAHGIVGRIVAFCIGHNKELKDLTLRNLREFYPGFERDVFAHLDVRHCINVRKAIGGTSQDDVKRRIEEISAQ